MRVFELACAICLQLDYEISRRSLSPTRAQFSVLAIVFLQLR